MALPIYQALSTISGGLSSGSTPNVAWPTHVANDIGILFLVTDHAAGADVTSVPSGFTEIGHSSYTTSSGALQCKSYWKRATSSSEANVTFPSFPAGVGWRVCLLTFRGCVTTGDPIHKNNGQFNNNTNVVMPSVTTTVSDCLIILYASTGRDASSAANYGGWTNANLTTITERVDSVGTDGGGAGFGIATGGKATAGVTGSSTVTTGSADPQYGVTLALLSVDSIGSYAPQSQGLNGNLGGHLGGRF